MCNRYNWNDTNNNMLDKNIWENNNLCKRLTYQPLKCQSRQQQMTNFATSFLMLRKNKEWYFMILMKYHALIVIFEKVAKFEIVWNFVCCKL